MSTHVRPTFLFYWHCVSNTFQEVVKKSRFCAQKLAVYCVNANVTDRVHYRTCKDNGTNQTGIYISFIH